MMDDFVPTASPRMGIVSDTNEEATKPIRKTKLTKNSSNSVTFDPGTNFSQQASHTESHFTASTSRRRRGINGGFDRDDSYSGLQTKGVHPWQRILYTKQAYRDNHYDPRTFFSHMTIVNYSLLSPFAQSPSSMARPVFYYFYTYSQAILHASLLVQQFSAVTFFLTIYQLIRLEVVTLEALWLLNIVALITGSFAYFYLLTPSSSSNMSLFSKLRGFLGLSTNQLNSISNSPPPPPSSSSQYNNRQNTKSIYEFIRVSILFVVCLKIAAPVIRTLTSAVSEDTIYATAMILSILHLLSHDYLPPVGSNHSFNSSTNIADEGTPPNNLSVTDVGNKGTSTNLNTGISSSTLTSSSSSSSFNHNNSVSSVDYSRHSSRTAMVSLSTGMFTAMMLASRLHTADLVVAFIIFAIITFTLFPIVCRMLLFHNVYLQQKPVSSSSPTTKASSPNALGFLQGLQIVLVLIQWMVTSRVLWLLDHPSVMKLYFPTMKPTVDRMENNHRTDSPRAEKEALLQDGSAFFVIYQLFVVLLWLVAPTLFVWLQRYKQILRGAWDIPEVPSS